MKLKNYTLVFIMFVFIFMIGMPLTNVTAAAKPEGTLTVAFPTLATEGYLTDRNSTTTSALWECVYDYLIYSDRTGRKSIPGLAERWEYSKDYKSLTFWLRKGIQFHNDWGELTADDVKFSIDLSKRKGSRNVKRLVLKNVTSVDVIDPYTVTLRLKKPDPLLWVSFSTVENMASAILCKKYVETVGEEKANREPIGSGPYRLIEHKIGDFAKFEAFDKHWLVVPEFKYMILRIIPEESTRIAMLKTGAIDVAEEIGINKKTVFDKANLRSIVSKDSNTLFIPFGGMLTPGDRRYDAKTHLKDPWVDVRVREAMNLAIDRKSIVKNIYQDMATPSAVYASIPGWDEAAPIPYDPQRAKQLLAEAGYPNGFSFKVFTTLKDPTLPLIAEAAAGFWGAIGLKPEIVRIDYATWRSRNKKGKTGGAVWTNVMMNYFDWSGRIAGHDLPNSSTPFWDHEETTVAINKALYEIDNQKREAYWKEVSKLYRSLYINVPIAFIPRLHGVGKKVGEWYPSSLRYPRYLIFARHAKPLNTWRLLTP